MKIFIIGFMGSGKSTLGKPVAREMECEFVDLDRYLEEQEQSTIADVFRDKGESYFRELERRYLMELSEKENLVLATGGGTPCFFDNMDMMNRLGVTVYLKQDPEILVSRLLKSHRERPLIKGMDRVELVEYISKELVRREEFYNKASIIANNPSRDAERVVMALKYRAEINSQRG